MAGISLCRCIGQPSSRPVIYNNESISQSGEMIDQNAVLPALAPVDIGQLENSPTYLYKHFT